MEGLWADSGEKQPADFECFGYSWGLTVQLVLPIKCLSKSELRTNFRYEIWVAYSHLSWIATCWKFPVSDLFDFCACGQALLAFGHKVHELQHSMDDSAPDFLFAVCSAGAAQEPNMDAQFPKNNGSNAFDGLYKFPRFNLKVEAPSRVCTRFHSSWTMWGYRKIPGFHCQDLSDAENELGKETREEGSDSERAHPPSKPGLTGLETYQPVAWT